MPQHGRSHRASCQRPRPSCERGAPPQISADLRRPPQTSADPPYLSLGFRRRFRCRFRRPSPFWFLHPLKTRDSLLRLASSRRATSPGAALAIIETAFGPPSWPQSSFACTTRQSTVILLSLATSPSSGSLRSNTLPQEADVSSAFHRGPPAMSPPNAEPEQNVEAIVGGVVGAVAALAAIGVVVFLLLRRRRKRPSPQAPVLQMAPRGSSTYAIIPQSHDSHMNINSQHAK